MYDLPSLDTPLIPVTANNGEKTRNMNLKLRKVEKTTAL